MLTDNATHGIPCNGRVTLIAYDPDVAATTMLLQKLKTELLGVRVNCNTYVQGDNRCRYEVQIEHLTKKHHERLCNLLKHNSVEFSIHIQ